MALGRLGEHVQKAQLNSTPLKEEVENIVRNHFTLHSFAIDKNSVSQYFHKTTPNQLQCEGTHSVFVYLLNHNMNSFNKNNRNSNGTAIQKFKGIAEDYGFYHCFFLNLIRNVFVGHQPSDLKSLYLDIDNVVIPDVEVLLNSLRDSHIVKQDFSSFEFYWTR